MDIVEASRRGIPEARHRAVEVERVAAAEAVAEESGEAAERDRLVADHKPGGVRVRDSDAVADVERDSVGADLWVKGAVDDQQGPGLGRPARVGRGFVKAA